MDLLRKLDSCQGRAVTWQKAITSTSRLPATPDGNLPAVGKDRLWKAFTIITDSYDEWGIYRGKSVYYHLNNMLNRLHPLDPNNPPWTLPDGSEQQFQAVCLTTAGALAADRSTKFLPVIVAQILFISTTAIALVRTKSAEQNPSTYVNIEVYSIGYTALYFWLIPAVMMSSVIGVSQSSEALPRILKRFATDLQHAGIVVHLPTEERLHSENRKWDGGIYSWRPKREYPLVTAYRNAREEIEHVWRLRGIRAGPRIVLLWAWPLIYFLLPYVIFAGAIGSAMWLTSEVPPEGWSCRSWGQTIIWATWFFNHLLSLVLSGSQRKQKFVVEKLFIITFLKDFLCFCITMGMVLATQFGIYNKCDCYTNSGNVGLALPEQDATANTVRQGLEVGGIYTVIVTLGLVLQVAIVPLLLLWRYYDAFRVFLQKDDGTSNLDPVQPVLERIAPVCNCCFSHGTQESQDNRGQGHAGGTSDPSSDPSSISATPSDGQNIPTGRDTPQPRSLDPSSSYPHSRHPNERLHSDQGYGIAEAGQQGNERAHLLNSRER